MQDQEDKKLVGFRALFGAALTVWLLLTVIAFAVVVNGSIRQVETEFRQHAEQTVAELRDKLKANEAVLTGFASFLGAVEAGDHRSVRQYAGSMLASYPHIHLLEVARQVERRDRSAFEREQKLRQDPGFGIRGLDSDGQTLTGARTAKGSYRPIVFVWPEHAEARALLGVDLDSIPYLRVALADADARRVPMASAPFQLLDGSTAYVMFKSAERSPALAANRPERSFAGPLTALLVIRAEALLPTSTRPDTQQRLHIARNGSVIEPALYELAATDPASSIEARLFPTLRLQTGDYSTSQPMQLTVERQIRFADIASDGLKLMTLVSLLMLSLLLSYLRRHHQELVLARQLDAKSRHLAFHDALTGLPNRHLLEDRVHQALANWRRRGVGFALLFLDLDRFKEINDEYGHETGDRLLSAVSRRLEEVVRESDTVARYGGDEFVILLVDTTGEADVLAVGNKILEAVGQPYEFGATTLNVTTSLGIGICPEDGDDFDALLGSADAAMYGVKRAGRNGVGRAVVHGPGHEDRERHHDPATEQVARIRLVS